MKAIMINIRPQYVAKILNGEKTIEIRKKFPKDYVGWVYIYCTKEKPSVNIYRAIGIKENVYKAIHSLNEYQASRDLDNFMNDEFVNKYPQYGGKRITFRPTNLNGKVVARFWCDKVDNYVNGSKIAFENGTYIFGTNADFEVILKPSCLTEDELYDYCEDLSFKAIHITKLEIFDKPKEISEFWTSNYNKGAMCDNEPQFPCTKCPNTGVLYCNCKFLLNGNCSCISLTRAPSNYCYIEI